MQVERLQTEKWMDADYNTVGDFIFRLKLSFKLSFKPKSS